MDKLVSVSTEEYISHLGWEDCYENRKICTLFIEYFGHSMGNISFCHREDENKFFVKLLKAHFEILKKKDADLSEEEWEKVEKRFSISPGIRAWSEPLYKIRFQRIYHPGPQEY